MQDKNIWFVILIKIFKNFQDGATGVPSTESAVHQHDDPLASDKDLFIDDDGSGVEIDESSGSGWGPGPGPDDEDARAGSGDAPKGPEDDEDFTPRTTTEQSEPGDFETDYSEEPETGLVPETAPTILPVDQFDVVSREQRLKHASFVAIIS